MTHTLRKYISTFMTIPHSILLRMGNVSNESCRESPDALCMFSNFFPKITPFVR